MHYSQLRSSVETSLQTGAGDFDVLHVQLQGFIDVRVLEERLDELVERVERHAPDSIMCDLRAVAGYGPGTPALASEWLMLVRRAGIRRVALVAASSVLQTHALMLARDLGIEMRCFLGATEASRWLSAT